MPNAPKDTSPPSSRFDQIFTVQSALQLVNHFSPTMKDTVQVEIVGQPDANLDDIYLLSIGIANGIINSNFFGGLSRYTIQTNIDFKNKTVKCILAYDASGIENTASTVNGPKLMLAKIYSAYTVFDYPDLIKSGEIKSMPSKGDVSIDSSVGAFNPQLKNGQGTYGDVSFVAVEAPFTDPCSKGEIPTDINNNQNQARNAAMANLKLMFGVD